ncbi:type II secretion system secretin GspD [Bordetella petrii]|uniref:type II secretion system secretin GspD n=1 Tax=Bordetella petrii TaxID=94624 RepID=UPI003D6C77D1
MQDPSPLIVSTSTGQGWRQEAPPPRAAPVPRPRPAAAAPERPASQPAAALPDAPAAGSTAGGGITLNFVDADLPGVIRALARFTGRNFLVDPRVKGKLTLVSETPVDRATAYSMLLGALRMQGFAVVDTGGVSRVVPEADAKLQGMAVTDGTAPGTAHSGELVTRVFQLRYENAANLVPVLRPMIAPNNSINVYAGNNTLVITDYADNIKRIAEVIASIDTPDSFSTDLVTVDHGVAVDVAALASQVLNQGAAGNAAQRVTVVADPRSNSVLLRASSPEKLQQARALIHRIDNPETRAGNLHVVYLRNAQASRLAEVLRGALSGQPTGQDNLAGGGLSESGLGADSTLTGAASGMGAGSALANAGLRGSGGTTLAGAALADPADAMAGAGGNDTRSVAFTAGGATVQADPATNTLIISAPPPLYRSLREIIDQLDQRRAQVLVESLIVEVSSDKAAEFGIQWMTGGGGIDSGNSSFIGGANFGGSGLNTSGVTTIDALGQGLSLGVVKGTVNVLGKEIVNLSVLARALESTGGANILSTPNLLTLDNEEASIMVGRTVPFVTGQYTTSGDGASNPFQTISREDVGLTLRIRPQISEGGTVKLALYQEVSSIDASVSVAANGLVTRKRALETNVLVDDSQIIVLGGLIEDVVNDTTKAVPVLSSIPFIGNFFRYDSRSHSKTNLMIFLRPHILRTPQDSASMTLDRYNYIRAVQTNLPPRSTWFSPDASSVALPDIDRDANTGLLDLRMPGAAQAAPAPTAAQPGGAARPAAPAASTPGEHL